MAYSYGEYFRILEIQRYPADLQELQGILKLQGPAPAEPPAVRIWDLIKDVCQTAVVESNYIDLDYRRGYGRFHYLRHSDTDRRCLRIHFFGTEIRRNQFFNFPRNVRKAYLGFTVVRPLPAFKTGRTVLSDRVLPASPDLGAKYLTCKASYPVNLAGNQLDIVGAPYMQQDTLVSACASAAVWVAAWHMAFRYAPDFRACFTPEITDMATKYTIPTGRAMPSEGLTLEQMMNALREMGYDPLPYIMLKSKEEVRNIIYRYVESEIPVILSLVFPNRGGHAVTAVGHTFDTEIEPQLREVRVADDIKLTYCLSSDFVPAFIIQDDAKGPFRLMELLSLEEAVTQGFVSGKETKEAAKYGCPCLVLFDRGTPFEQQAYLRAILVPLPPGITLDGYGAEERSMALLETWFGILAKRVRAAPQNLVLRTFLQLSNELKVRFGSELKASRQLQTLLRQHLMSRWVWVTEISDVPSLRTSRLAIGQIIQDCAGHPGPASFDLLVAHLPPHLMVTWSPSGDSDISRIKDYRAYPSFARHSA